jgi:hypothetical protein
LEFFLVGLIVMAAVALNVRQIRGMFSHVTGAHVQESLTPREWENSNAVLPFQNMSGDEDQEYSAMG